MAIAAGKRLLVFVRKQDKEVLRLHYILSVLPRHGIRITYRFVGDTGDLWSRFCAAYGQAVSLSPISVIGYLREVYHGQTGCCYRRERKSWPADCL